MGNTSARDGFAVTDHNCGMCDRDCQPRTGSDKSDLGLLAAPLFHRTPAPNSAIASKIPAMISSTLMTVSRFIVGSWAHRPLLTDWASQDRRFRSFDHGAQLKFQLTSLGLRPRTSSPVLH